MTDENNAQKTDSKLDVVELLLTCECYNAHTELDAHDLPSPIRVHYWDTKAKGVPRPLSVCEKDVKETYGVQDVKGVCAQLPFVEYAEFGEQISLMVMELAISWFIKSGGLDRIAKNPTIAHHCEKEGVRGA
ncbi:MAG: ATP-binding protein, partial [Methermicoccaceae archaeon]